MTGCVSRAESFRFDELRFDPATGRAELCYVFDDGPVMVETLEFPGSPWPQNPQQQAAFQRALELLHQVAGVSYYKAALARQIDAGCTALDERRSLFLNTLYEQGLAEFAHLNDLDLDGMINFPVSTGEFPEFPPLDLPERALVAMGGGKDSLVSLELLRESGVEIQPFCVGGSELIGKTVDTAGLSLLRIRRKLAPELEVMNEAGAWNGHVPVTAINSAIGVCAALLYGYRYVIFSNERSADEPTLVNSKGQAVNHQYSKSFRFEQDFSALVRRDISPSLKYFSLLRPMGELGVTSRFSRIPQYHEVFSSCNRNFHQDGSHISGRWCGDCPKCRFTTLALAPFMTPADIARIFSVNLLEDVGQVAGFAALCALGADKPFECVGTAQESRAALAALAGHAQWQDCRVVRELAPALAGVKTESLQDCLGADGPHEIPGEVYHALTL